MIKSLVFTFLFIIIKCQDSPCDQICTPQEDCPEFLNKKQEFLSKYKRGQPGYEEALTKIKGWICNKKKKSVWCPSSDGCEEEFSSGWLPRKGECGLAPQGPLGRVVGGNDTTIGQFPFTALLGYPDRRQTGGREKTVYKCGGTLINHWYVLTAAHCQGKSTESQISRVRLGEWDVGKDEDCIKIDDTTRECLDTPQDFSIRAEQVTIHENYDITTQSVVNDIALVKLDRPAVLNNGVQIVCLPVDEDEAARELNLPDLDAGLTGKYPTVVGWGHKYNRDEGDFRICDVARCVQQMLGVPVLSVGQCKEKWKGVDETHICAGGEQGKDSCRVIIVLILKYMINFNNLDAFQGDSGGPLYLSKVAPSGHPEPNDINPVYLLGLVSFGSKFCGEGLPGVYTRVNSFVPWIEEKIGRN